MSPLPRRVAALAVARCLARSLVLLVRRRVRFPRTSVGTPVRFADGSASWIYRETVVDGGAVDHPCALVVCFRLRWVRGRGHALFRAESLLNTPLFVGFPGFVAKWWLAADEHGAYRGLYEWDGADRAEAYARALWRVLELVSIPGSIAYTVLPGCHRDDLLTLPDDVLADGAESAWWRPVAS